MLRFCSFYPVCSIAKWVGINKIYSILCSFESNILENLHMIYSEETGKYEYPAEYNQLLAFGLSDSVNF